MRNNDRRFRKNIISKNMISKSIISGHGKIAGGNIVKKYINYLSDVIIESKQLHEDKKNINNFVSKLSLNSEIEIEDDIRDLMEGFHKWNVLNAYKQLN